MMQNFKKEFQLFNFGLNHCCVGDFYNPLCIPHIALIIIRIVIAFYTTAAMLADLVDFIEAKKNGRWFVFFTSWNYMMCVTYFILVTIGTVSYYSKKRRGCDPDVPMSSMNPTNQYASTNNMLESSGPDSAISLPESSNGIGCYDRIVWVFFNITLAVCTLVVAAYWIILFDGSQDLDFFNIDRHGIILVVTLIDFSLHRIPYRVLHFVYPMAFFTVYFIFHVIYSFASEDLIYKTIDWHKNPTKAGILFAIIIVLSGVFHFIFYWIDYGKKALGNKCCQSNTLA